MITRIILENFMAHERTELPLGPGVTALTGPNNTGKSAVVEALRCVVTNPAPRNFIRHGAREARVTVELEDGTRVVWIRKKASAGYELWAPGAETPEEFWKIRRRPPDAVLAALRLDLVELEGDKAIDVHLGNQREPVFLLNRPDSDAAAFFAASSESAHLLAMQNRLKRRTLEASRRERDLEDRCRDIELALDDLAPLPGIGLALDRARALEADAERLAAAIPALETHRARLAATARALDRCRALGRVFAVLAAPPVLADAAGPDRLLRRMRAVTGDLRHTRAELAALAPAAPPPAPFDAIRLATLCRRVRHLDAALRKTGERDRLLAPLRRPPEPARTENILDILDKMRRLERSVQGAEERCGRLLSIAEPPVAPSPAGLAALVADMGGLSTARAAASGRVEDLAAQLRQVAEAVGRVVDALGRCPVCGAALDRETFLEHGLEHGPEHAAATDGRGRSHDA